MGLLLFVLLIGMEIAYAVWAVRGQKDRKLQRKARLIVRAAETALAGIMLLLPFGQRWRFVPVFAVLAVLLLIAAINALIQRKKEENPRKKAGVSVLCVLNVLLFLFLLIPSFVFTGYNGLPLTGEYETDTSAAILIDRSRQDPFEQDGSFREVPVHFYYPVTDGTERFPLVVFSHGAFGYYQSNTSTYMELASHGYVVASLDHPHHAFFTKDTDGETVLVDMQFFADALTVSNAEEDIDREWEWNLMRQWMDLRTADMNFAVDTLKRAAENGALDDSWFFLEEDRDPVLTALGKTDVTKIGLMGHSMGGATSVALGRERDDITAVIDIDGTMLSEYTGVQDGRFLFNQEPYTVPVLEFINHVAYNERRADPDGDADPIADSVNDQLMQNASVGFMTTIEGTEHMDFTDLPLLSPALGNLLGSGTRDSRETMQIVNSLVLRFFDCYLKGEGAFAVQDRY